jgi:hypothetical protein
MAYCEVGKFNYNDFYSLYLRLTATYQSCGQLPPMAVHGAGEEGHTGPRRWVQGHLAGDFGGAGGGWNDSGSCE